MQNGFMLVVCLGILVLLGLPVAAGLGTGPLLVLLLLLAGLMAVVLLVARYSEGRLHDEGPVAVMAPPVSTPQTEPEVEQQRRVGLHLALLVATLLTTTWVGALRSGVNLLAEPSHFLVGVPFAVALLAILGAHELGHYVVARAYGMSVTLPYFIPVPFAMGTFGAFIQMKSIAPTRRAMFDVAVAGPLAGLALAVPAMVVGLHWSQLVPVESGILAHGQARIGSSLLFASLARLVFPQVAAHGHALMLHPLAVAGWLGLVVTAMNLLPIGQLDGGHMADAMFGSRIGRTISTVAIFSLVMLGLFGWSGMLPWMAVVLCIARTKGAPPLDDVTHMPSARVALGFLTFLLLAAILPVPREFHQWLNLLRPHT